MSYMVKSIFGPTVQGEGSLTGTVTHFLRFAGCNMWNGREADRASSQCPYCDTDFLGGERLEVDAIVERLCALPRCDWVTISGGEPLLQLDEELAIALRRVGFKLAVETNGTRALSLGLAAALDHVSCSPKVPPEEIKLTACDDLKVLWPHPNPKITPAAFRTFTATHRFLQPINGHDSLDTETVKRATAECFSLCAQGSAWRLSVQLHKVIGVE